MTKKYFHPYSKAVARKKTRGDCLFCKQPTRRFNTRWRKYVCLRCEKEEIFPKGLAR